jgi:hypothetical protein
MTFSVQYCHTECRIFYRNAEFLRVKCLFAYCHYAEGLLAECCYAEHFLVSGLSTWQTDQALLIKDRDPYSHHFIFFVTYQWVQ